MKTQHAYRLCTSCCAVACFLSTLLSPWSDRPLRASLHWYWVRCGAWRSRGRNSSCKKFNCDVRNASVAPQKRTKGRKMTVHQSRRKLMSWQAPSTTSSRTGPGQLHFHHICTVYRVTNGWSQFRQGFCLRALWEEMMITICKRLDELSHKTVYIQHITQGWREDHRDSLLKGAAVLSSWSRGHHLWR